LLFSTLFSHKPLHGSAARGRLFALCTCDLASPSEGVQRSTREGSTQHSKEFGIRRSKEAHTYRSALSTRWNSSHNTGHTGAHTRQHAGMRCLVGVYSSPLLSSSCSPAGIGFRCGSCGGCSAMDAGGGCEWWTMGGSSFLCPPAAALVRVGISTEQFSETRVGGLKKKKQTNLTNKTTHCHNTHTHTRSRPHLTTTLRPPTYERTQRPGS
jgi:hypothetical protein